MDQTSEAFHSVLLFAGISIYAKNNWNSRWWLFLQIFVCFIGLLTVIFTSAFVIINRSDLLLCIQGACIWTTGVIMFISQLVCLIFRQNFRVFLTEMGLKDGIYDMSLIRYVFKEERGDKLNELRDIVVESQNKLLRVTRTVLKTYVASVWLSATLYICGGIYMTLFLENESKRLLAFDMWFPWSLDNIYVYIASFTFHCMAGYLCCIIFPGHQSTIVLLVGQIIRQLKILSFILFNLNEISQELVERSSYKKEDYCICILEQCLDHYIKLKSFSNRLNVICRPFYFALILVATMLVCMCSVKIAVSDKLSFDTMKYCVHELCFIMMVLMFCLLGQQVENECERLEQAITEKWYIYNRKHKIYVKIFSMAARQGMPIYIFGTITLSLPTFTQFIRNWMSFFTLVMSVLEG